MKKSEAVAEFNTMWAEELQCNPEWEKDRPRKRMYFNDYTDTLCKEGRITQHQYDTWTSPVK